MINLTAIHLALLQGDRGAWQHILTQATVSERWEIVNYINPIFLNAAWHGRTEEMQMIVTGIRLSDIHSNDFLQVLTYSDQRDNTR